MGGSWPLNYLFMEEGLVMQTVVMGSISSMGQMFTSSSSLLSTSSLPIAGTWKPLSTEYLLVYNTYYLEGECTYYGVHLATCRCLVITEY